MSLTGVRIMSLQSTVDMMKEEIDRLVSIYN